jgi:SAM-dependent methyltransferase
VTQEVTGAIARYVLDGSDDDLKRLLQISEVTAEFARVALDRVGVQHGWRAIECGCGPLGALPVLADAVGASGTVVGVDLNEGAVDRARSIMQTLGVNNVDVLVGDLHDTAPAALGAPFDLAYSRQFLLHQPYPVRTLTCIAEVLRPGGVLVAQEPFRNPPWRSRPPITELSDHWEILYESIERAGTPHEAVEDLPRFARAAGLEVTAQSGFCPVLAPEVGLQIALANMAAVRDRALALGAATEQQFDGRHSRTQRRTEKERRVRVDRNPSHLRPCLPKADDAAMKRSRATVAHTSADLAHPRSLLAIVLARRAPRGY